MLDSKQIYAHDEKFNFFDSFENSSVTNGRDILINVFSFVCSGFASGHVQLVVVCKKWYDINSQYLINQVKDETMDDVGSNGNNDL